MLCVEGVQNSLPFVIGDLGGGKLFLQCGNLAFSLRYHTTQQLLGKGTLAPQDLDDFCFQQVQFCGGFCVFGPDGLEQQLPLLHFIPIPGVDNLALVKPLFPLLSAPDLHAVFDKPLHYKEGLVCDTANAVKHEQQQDVELPRASVSLDDLEPVPVLSPDLVAGNAVLLFLVDDGPAHFLPI